jgi:hypothetical protein
MSSAAIVAGAGNGLFILAMCSAAVRCLLLWRRTRQAPELFVGIGFLSIAGLGYPLMAASGVSGASAADVNLFVLAAGLVAVGAGVVSLQVFTWRAFRPDARWAWGIVAASGLVALAVCWGGSRAIAQAPADLAPVAVSREWWLVLRGLFEVWYLWTAIEGLREWRQARKRMTLGLSDPLVVDRFFLWGAMGLFLSLNGAVASWLEWNGASPLHDLSAALTLALNGGVAGALIGLIFLPPQAYRDWVRRRAGAVAAG